tara:strand:- start:15647 stop:16597 length:951 start_codon:yes stop_codon:yes gene_type:complete
MDEFDIIRRYFLDALMPNYVSTGPGDDCAVFSVPSEKSLCVSTDTLLAGVHFPLDAAPDVVATRAFGANLSDLAAMGAEPYAATVALTIPSGDADWLGRFSAASRTCSELHRCPVVGGNLAKGALSITLTVMGVVPDGTALLRSGAGIEDDIYVSGFLGDSAGAVKQLGRDDANADLLGRYQNPEPRLRLGAELLGVASAAIDISDGFVSDLGHLVESSGVSAVINRSQIPVSNMLVKVFGRAVALDLALNGGDDYELCFTAAQEYRDQINAIGKQLDLNLSRLGEIVSKRHSVSGARIVDADGQEIEAAGYRHFL